MSRPSAEKQCAQPVEVVASSEHGRLVWFCKCSVLQPGLFLVSDVSDVWVRLGCIGFLGLASIAECT